MRAPRGSKSGETTTEPICFDSAIASRARSGAEGPNRKRPGSGGGSGYWISMKFRFDQIRMPPPGGHARARVVRTRLAAAHPFDPGRPASAGQPDRGPRRDRPGVPFSTACAPRRRSSCPSTTGPGPDPGRRHGRPAATDRGTWPRSRCSEPPTPLLIAGRSQIGSTPNSSRLTVDEVDHHLVLDGRAPSRRKPAARLQDRVRPLQLRGPLARGP